ncbi:MAG: RNA 2',3'-cyclic phosphodiesterase [Steroidobacteraceae bacterium]
MSGLPIRRRRLFFALWPTDELREQIASDTHEWIARCGGAAIPPSNFHVTLAFLGAVPEESLERICEIGAQLRGPPFEFTLDTIESWSAAGVLCLTATQPAPSLLSLAARLRFSLLEQQVDSAPQEFRPHVSLARAPSARIDAPIGPMIWPVCEVVLVESSNAARGSQYRILDRWTLKRETV